MFEEGRLAFMEHGADILGHFAGHACAEGCFIDVGVVDILVL